MKLIGQYGPLTLTLAGTIGAALFTPSLHFSASHGICVGERGSSVVTRDSAIHLSGEGELIMKQVIDTLCS